MYILRGFKYSLLKIYFLRTTGKTFTIPKLIDSYRSEYYRSKSYLICQYCIGLPYYVNQFTNF